MDGEEGDGAVAEGGGDEEEASDRDIENIAGESVVLLAGTYFVLIIFSQDYILTMQTKKMKIFFMGQRSRPVGE